jgi:hypothetical protein
MHRQTRSFKEGVHCRTLFANKARWTLTIRYLDIIVGFEITFPGQQFDDMRTVYEHVTMFTFVHTSYSRMPWRCKRH